ncbi:hypothetical protein F1728_03610 [Gimesia benthica]|uniref:Glycosyltransferase RgtA/B/C/D-like domain-containing protein n=1 Tax=Gimesia benthica TaxID=2608982 RepID=A0A6I6A9Y5_9PLAN|nr:hypothetical protein [Gimesia benthica]QGQ21831.1 hypothetical protein F1728_03610 [Gimesia benthica]
MSQREWLISLGLIWCACLFLISTVTIADPDLWGHTLYGIRALEADVLVEHTDPFCYTEPGATWINHEWFSEDSFGWLWLRFGNTGLWLWRNFWLLMIMIPGWLALRSQRASLAGGLLLLVYTAFCLSQFVVFVRPQLVTFGCFAWTLLLLRGYLADPQRKAIWYLPVLMLFWANSHGGFLAGVGVQGLVVCWMGWKTIQGMYRPADFWRLAFVIVFAWAVTLINPYGVGLHQMLWDHLVTKQIVREWQPLWEARQALLYYIPFLLIGLAFFGSRKWEWIDVLLIIVVAYQALSHIRHVSLLAIAVLILLPAPLSEGLHKLLPRLHQRWAGPQRTGSRMLLVGGLLLGIYGLSMHTIVKLWQQQVAPWQIGVETQSRAPGMPVAAIEILQQADLRGNILTDYGWAQYVIWQTFPESRIAFDGRYRTVYSAQLEQELVEFQQLNADSMGPTPLLDAYPTEILLLPAAQPVQGYLKQRSDWKQVYADAQSTIWLKDLPRFQPIISRAKQKLLPVPEIPLWILFPGDPPRQKPGEASLQTGRST